MELLRTDLNAIYQQPTAVAWLAGFDFTPCPARISCPVYDLSIDLSLHASY